MEPLQRALEDAGYKNPTEIQSRAIPEALQGRDVLGCAQTGTGKTAAFVVPVLHDLGSNRRKSVPHHPFVLMLAPTRELAIQIGKSISNYGKHLKLRTTLVYGGVNQNAQVRAIKRGAHILVATPGRLLDLMDQGHISLDQLEIFVADEADRMLDMGFLPDLKKIIRCLPEQRQSLFFSATLAPKITALAKTLLVNPSTINVAPKVKSVEKIEQKMLRVEPGEKLKHLHDILIDPTVELSVVFTRTKRGANALEKKLTKSGFKAAAIHGDKSQANRQRTLDAFRKGRIKVLVATDVAARGIDVSNVSHVVNYDIPTEPESYVHRIGRTGRAGARGIAITFYASDQKKLVRDIERFIGKRLTDEVDRGDGPKKPRGQKKPSKKPGPNSGQKRRKKNPRGSKGSTKSRHAEFSTTTARRRRKKRPASSNS